MVAQLSASIHRCLDPIWMTSFSYGCRHLLWLLLRPEDARPHKAGAGPAYFAADPSKWCVFSFLFFISLGHDGISVASNQQLVSTPKHRHWSNPHAIFLLAILLHLQNNDTSAPKPNYRSDATSAITTS